MNKRKFVVLGAGTAGWITAHYARILFPDDDITLVYSEAKGTVGVGEATTPQMVSFLEDIGIDLLHFLKTVGGTIKHGISFENWNGIGSHYYHPFIENITEFGVPNFWSHDCWEVYNKLLINKNLPFDEYLYQCKLINQNKIDLNHTNFAVHFNTYKFAKYMKWFAESSSKNIKMIEGEVISFEQNDNGDIKKVILTDQTVNCDFVFDCSGFAKLVIGKLYNQEWISYKQHLPMDKAISFWIDSGETLKPSTSAVAMKYGWVWKIPLQDRTGCGYVYDSTYINAEQAQHEAEEYFQQKLNVRKEIKIDAGRFKNVWVNNCIAVGLSGNFIEPLESTSIWLELSLLDNFKHFANEIDKPNKDSIALFNEIIGNEVDEKMNFVYMHYMTKRNDSDFWREFRDKHPMPEKLKKLWPFIVNNNLRYFQLKTSMCPGTFPLMSYLWICQGLELFETPGNLDMFENVQPSPEEYKQIIDEWISTAPDQKTFLSSL